MDLVRHIETLIDKELAAALAASDPVWLRTAEEFERLRRTPRAVRVNFSGGIEQVCWSVSRGDGTYRVVYLPTAGYFALCVESDFGPLDIGVHGDALKCFASV